MSISIKFDGQDKLEAALADLSRKAAEHVGSALREEAEIEMTEAKQRTPVDTGALRASGRVTGPEYEGKDVVVKLEFGNSAAHYAVYVHENLEALHKVGRAKFLESTLVESAPHLAQRIATRIASKMGL